MFVFTSYVCDSIDDKMQDKHNQKIMTAQDITGDQMIDVLFDNNISSQNKTVIEEIIDE